MTVIDNCTETILVKGMKNVDRQSGKRLKGQMEQEEMDSTVTGSDGIK